MSIQQTDTMEEVIFKLTIFVYSAFNTLICSVDDDISLDDIHSGLCVVMEELENAEDTGFGSRDIVNAGLQRAINGIFVLYNITNIEPEIGEFLCDERVLREVKWCRNNPVYHKLDKEGLLI